MTAVRGGAGIPSIVSRRGLLAAGACLTCLAPLTVSGRETPAAERFIQELGERTIDVLNRTGADETARTRGMAELLEGAVDFEAVAGFTHERGGSLTTGRAGRSPIEAIGGEWHDRRLGGVLCRT